MEERVQKLLAEAGIASRRKCEELIKEGKVQVNGKDIKLGDKATKKDRITLNGRRVSFEKKPTYILLNKPSGYITTVTDMWNRKKVVDLLPPQYKTMRLYPVGRLDRDAEGLLILTDDGTFANRVMHPRYTIEKTYRCWLDRKLQSEDKKLIQKGFKLKDGYVKGVKIFEVTPKCYDIRIHIGKNKIVKRIFNHFNYNVNRLKRIRIGKLNLPRMALGEVKVLSESDRNKIFSKDEKKEQKK